MSAAQGSLVNWDVFHADSLELERGLSTAAIRTALAGGALCDDDLVRPAGTTAAWARLADIPELSAPENGPVGPPLLPASSSAPPIAEPALRPDAGPIRTAPAEEPPQRAEVSDFEIEAEDRTAPYKTAPAPTIPPPAWLQLGGEPDDVAFPVMPDRPAAHRPPEPSQPEAESTAALAWNWVEDGDENKEEDDEVGASYDAEFDEQIEILDDDGPAGLEILDEDHLTVPSPFSRESFAESSSSRVALPVVASRDWNEDRQPVEGGEEEGDFTFTRSGPMTVEELDLAPMVDVAFQLVLFFMVTATTVLFKTLEIPKPSADPPPGAVTQGISRSLDDFKDAYVIVEIDASGAMKVDHEPVQAELNALVERLRTAREKTNRTSMLVAADSATPHRHAVLAYDAANEIGMSIAIAKPKAPQAAGPGLLTGSGRPAQAPVVPTAATPAHPAAPAPPAPAPAATPFD
jgi:biopolymer transport protein ExbD